MERWPDHLKPPPSSAELGLEPGEPMETDRHLHQMMVLLESLDHAWHDRDDFYSGANTWLYFSETQAKRNDFRRPDLMIVLDTARRERRCWWFGKKTASRVGDESRRCCDVPAFGQTVVATGILLAIPPELRIGGVAWELEEVELCQLASGASGDANRGAPR